MDRNRSGHVFYFSFPGAVLSLLLLFFTRGVHAQELYPLAEPASNVPKGALGVRVFSQGYNEAGLFRTVSGLKLMYGVTPTLSVYATATFSDYHQRSLPFDFITHDHSGGQLVSGTNTPKEGVPYPVIFNSIDLFAKYRFYTSDGTNKHFRMAAYGECSYAAVPSHVAEPDLLVHTSGFGAGVIATYLEKHFAASVTLGGIVPLTYKANTYDAFGGIYPTTITYGNAMNYTLSFGYLLLPKTYTDYNQTNLNIYCEFTGRAYSAARVKEQDGPFAGALVYELPINTPILQAGNYIDIVPGIQCIIASTYRIDFSVQLPLVNKSYAHLYPLYMLGMQRYFFFKKRASKNNP